MCFILSDRLYFQNIYVYIFKVKLVHNEIIYKIFFWHKSFITFFILLYYILFPANALQISSEKELKKFSRYVFQKKFRSSTLLSFYVLISYL